MDFIEAFEILQLPINAPREEIIKKYKELAKVTHPDKGGIEDKMKSLSIARDIALTYSNKNQLVPIDTLNNYIAKDLIRIQKTIKEIEKTQFQITQRYSSRYKTYKHFTGLLAFAIGVLTLMANFFDPTVNPFRIVSPMENFVLIPMIFVLGIYYWFFSTMTENIKNLIDDALDEFDNKEIFATIATEIISSKDRQRITKSQLIELSILSKMHGVD